MSLPSIPNDVARIIAERVATLQDVTIAVYLDTLVNPDKAVLIFWVHRNAAAAPFHVTWGEQWYGEDHERVVFVRSEAALRTLLASQRDKFPVDDVAYFQGVSKPPMVLDLDASTSSVSAVQLRIRQFDDFVAAVMALVAEF